MPGPLVSECCDRMPRKVRISPSFSPGLGSIRTGIVTTMVRLGIFMRSMMPGSTSMYGATLSSCATACMKNFELE